jgi:subtilisin family serine protease
VSWLLDAETLRAQISRSRGSGVSIAILDSGVEVSHPALEGLLLMDDLVVSDDGPKLKIIPGRGRDVFGHGTAVAGVIRRLAPDAQIGSIRVLGTQNTSRTAVISRAAQEALDRGYQVLNCSFGCGVLRQVLDYKAWVDEAYLKGSHVVAACNNEDFTKPEWPAFFSSVIAVNMARTDDDNVFYYKRGTLIEFAAKGVDVDVLWLGGTQKRVTGSSFAVPRLSALVARLLSIFPLSSPLEIKAILHNIAQPWAAGIAPVSANSV